MNIEWSLPARAQYNPELGIYDIEWRGCARRKNTGSYYTPSCLIDCLLDYALTPLLEKSLKGAMSTLAVGMKEFRAKPKHAHDKHGHDARDEQTLSLPSLTICDPACGTGHFLVPAARRIARRMAVIRSGEEHPPAEIVRQTLCRVIEHCLYGVDIDPSAVELCKFNLWLEAGKPAGMTAILDRRIQCGDSLFFPWQTAFPEVFAGGGFDVLIGNPPFVNAIEGAISRETKKRLAALSDELRGTADLAFHFVRLSHALAKSGGTVGLVLPKTFLNAAAAVRLRERLCHQRPPSMIHVPRKAVYFPGAAAYTCLLVLGGDSACSVADDESPRDAAWRRGVISPPNWWRSFEAILGRVEESSPGEFVPLGGRFEVAASMTAGDAYAIKRCVRDDAAAAGPKLVTTGLIEPFACQWGQRKCRYLGSHYARPRIIADAELSPALLARLRKAATRPKLLVAGLCNRLEAFLDPEGEYLGAVSTYSIFHPADKVAPLKKLCAWLNSPRASALLRAELGAASVGGGFMTLKKKTLQELPMPKKG
jgi:hypothetical protein